VKLINDNHLENAQIQANMTVVHNILNGDKDLVVSASREVELAVAA
jgi:hypothetical protein